MRVGEGYRWLFGVGRWLGCLDETKPRATLRKEFEAGAAWGFSGDGRAR
jgi:hypothetical protein